MLRRQKHVLSQSTTPFACTLKNDSWPSGKVTFESLLGHFNDSGVRGVLGHGGSQILAALETGGFPIRSLRNDNKFSRQYIGNVPTATTTTESLT